jgi:hypothetical protein
VLVEVAYVRCGGQTRLWPGYSGSSQGGTPLKGVEATPASTLDCLCYYEMTSIEKQPLS